MFGRAATASLRPLAIHEYGIGSKSCRIRLVQNRSARLRPRPRPRLAFSSTLAKPSRPSSLAPAPRSGSPASSAGESRRMAASPAPSLRFGASLLALLVLRRAWRAPSRPTSLSSLIAPRQHASLAPHEANAPHVFICAATGFSPQRQAFLVCALITIIGNDALFRRSSSRSVKERGFLMSWEGFAGTRGVACLYQLTPRDSVVYNYCYRFHDTTIA